MNATFVKVVFKTNKCVINGTGAFLSVLVVLVVAVMERCDECGCFGSRGGCPCCVFL